jgi:hypothetical protein
MANGARRGVESELGCRERVRDESDEFDGRSLVCGSVARVFERSEDYDGDS